MSISIFLVSDLRRGAVEVMHADIFRFKENLATGGEAGIVQVLQNFMLRVNGDPLAAGEILKIDRVTAAMAVQLGEQSYIAAAHAGSGDLLAAAGDLSGAAKEYESAIAIFTKVGSKASVADARILLAQLRIEQGDAAAAVDLATQALQEFDTENPGRPP